MLNLNQEVEKIQEIESRKKDIEEQIILETETLQKRLVREDLSIISIKERLKSIISDENEHITRRFWTWLNYGEKGSLNYPIDGIMADVVFQEIVVLDKWSNVEEEMKNYFSLIIGDYSDLKVWKDDFIGTFDNMDEDEREEFGLVLEDAIEQNLSRFFFDC